jgi:hypothetical protein
MPKFKTEDEEREFWTTHDASEYLDWHPAQRAVFPNLKPSMRQSVNGKSSQHRADQCPGY